MPEVGPAEVSRLKYQSQFWAETAMGKDPMQTAQDIRIKRNLFPCKGNAQFCFEKIGGNQLSTGLS